MYPSSQGPTMCSNSYSQCKAPCVLLIDDDTHMHKIFGTVCDYKGLELFIAQTSEEVLDKLEKIQFAVIFIDMYIGDKVDGFRISEQITGSDLFNHCPLVSTSA